MTTGVVAIRRARDDDADDLIALIGGVFAEYPGCVLDVDGELPELRAIATSFDRAGGTFWVVEQAGKVVASIGLTPSADGRSIELRKLYVEKSARRAGLGSRLCLLVEHEARRSGAEYVELWSDTRFTDAHRLYERRGYIRGETTRTLGDKSNTEEYYFRLSF